MDKVYREEEPCCYFHPKEVFVGVCPLCLYERLIILASKRRRHRDPNSSSNSHVILPKIFALASLINRSHHHHHRNPINDDASPSQDDADSFISIRFDHSNNMGAWEKEKVHCNKSLVEHSKPQGSSLRWRKRIGQVFQLIKWKRTNKVSMRHVGSSKIEGVKVGGNGGWMRSLTKKTRE